MSISTYREVRNRTRILVFLVSLVSLIFILAAQQLSANTSSAQTIGYIRVINNCSVLSGASIIKTSTGIQVASASLLPKQVWTVAVAAPAQYTVRAVNRITTLNVGVPISGKAQLLSAYTC